ncbi:MAG: glycogen synthase GlgA [Candidatus Muiribacteriota bacterium]
MNITHICSELNPFIKTGGLADVTGSLPKAQAKSKNEINIIVPLYKDIIENYSLDYYADFPMETPLGLKTVIVKKTKIKRKLTVYFIGEHSYFYRDKIYGDYEDNPQRFAFFSKAALNFLEKYNNIPDVVHCHDWQTGLVSLYARGNNKFKNTVFGYTIHNIAFQGLFDFTDLYSLELNSYYFTPDKLEFFGKGSFLKAGIIYSDFVNTVSPTYRDETFTPEYGFGLQGLLEWKRKDYYGVINGIDKDEWNPLKDNKIFNNYSYLKIAEKEPNKKELLKKVNLPFKKDRALFVSITRLADQKGIDLIINSASNIVKKGHYLIILGSGDTFYEELLKEFEKKFPQNIRVFLRYDFELAHQLYAGGDFFLMPSKFEPCGLSQLISMRYGNIPVVRKTGGLADTVDDWSEKEKKATGFVFRNFDSDSFNYTINRALDVFKKEKDFKSLIKNCMKQNFSWDETAKTYKKLYEKYTKKNPEKY